MPLNFSASSVDNVRFGSSQVDKIYLGTNLVWQNITVTLVSDTYSTGPVSNSAPKAAADAGIRLNISGAAERKKGTSYTTLYTWLLSGRAGDYEVRASSFSGDALASGTLNTWQALSTSREWILGINRFETKTKTCTFLLEIRPAGGGSTLASATMTLSTERL